MSSTNALASILLSSCLFFLLKEWWRFLIAVKHSEWYFKLNANRSEPPSILVSKNTSCKSTAICLTLSLASVVLNFRSIPFSSWQNKQASVITDSRRWRFSTLGLLSLEPSRSRLLIARCTFWLLNFTWHDLCHTARCSFNLFAVTLSPNFKDTGNLSNCRKVPTLSINDWYGCELIPDPGMFSGHLRASPLFFWQMTHTFQSMMSMKSHYMWPCTL